MLSCRVALYHLKVSHDYKGILNQYCKYSSHRLESWARSTCFRMVRGSLGHLVVGLFFPLVTLVKVLSEYPSSFYLKYTLSYFCDFQYKNGNRNICVVPKNRHTVKGPIQRFFKEKISPSGIFQCFIPEFPKSRSGIYF